MNLVKYHNQMNQVNFNGFTEKEMNIFFSLLFLAKEKGANKLVIPFSDLKQLSDGDKNKDRFIKNLVNVNKKFIKLNHQIEIDNVIHIFSLFNTFSIDKNSNELTVQINEIFAYMLNNLIGNFTKFDLIEFVKLKSSYSKNMFKILKQWENIKSKEFSIEEFREMLGVPKCFEIGKIDARVLKPIMTELPQYFSGLKLEKIKTGRKITSLKFSWNIDRKKEVGIKDAEIVQDTEIEISDELFESFEKAEKNRFVKKVLTEDNKILLVEMFSEEQLIKGLNFARKEVENEIKSINYLIKTIKTANEQKPKKVLVRRSSAPAPATILSTNKTSVDDYEFEKKDDKIYVTAEHYEELFNKFLQETEEQDCEMTRKVFKMFNGSNLVIKEV